MVLFAVSTPLAAQAVLPLTTVSPARPSLCSPQQFGVPKPLTLRQRVCWYGSDLVSPWAAVRAGFSSGIGQWRNDPSGNGRDADDYAHRFAVYYARRSAREAGELVAGYFNHEDPRPRLSGQTVFKKRVRSALLSVLVTSDDNGNRAALAPIAGSLGSAFASVALYRNHTGIEYAFRGAGLTYAGYFGKALFREFQPDIRFYVRRTLHKNPD